MSGAWMCVDAWLCAVCGRHWALLADADDWLPDPPSLDDAPLLVAIQSAEPRDCCDGAAVRVPIGERVELAEEFVAAGAP